MAKISKKTAYFQPLTLKPINLKNSTYSSALIIAQ